MKKILFIVLIISSLVGVKGQENVRIDNHNLKWNLDYERANEISKQDKKPIFIWFTGSDWCGACKQVEQNYFSKKDFIKISDKFVLYEADFPKKENNQSELLKKVNEKLKKDFKIISFPTTIILDFDGNVIGRIIGFRGNETSKIYSDLLKAILNSI